MHHFVVKFSKFSSLQAKSCGHSCSYPPKSSFPEQVDEVSRTLREIGELRFTLKTATETVMVATAEQ